MSTSSPCAACKFLRRKCTVECVFAPYFPPDNPQKFANVHRVFGASNVSKLLSELHTCQREEAVNSLSYEAELRLRDPVYGCVGVISVLQHRLSKVQYDLAMARGELSSYIGPTALMPNLPHPQNDIHQHSNNLSHASSVFPGAAPHISHHQMIGMQTAVPHDGQFMVREPLAHQQFYQNASHQQMIELQQIAAMGDKLEMVRKSQQQQHQANYELAMFSNNGGSGSDVDLAKQVQMNDQALLDMSSSHHHDTTVYQFQQQPELLLQQSAPEHQQQRHAPKLELKATSEEGLSAHDPFC